MATWEMNINLPRRRAIIIVNEAISVVYDIEQGEHECFVLGLFQDNNAPVFVCELNDGKVVNIYTEYVRFLDKPEEAE